MIRSSGSLAANDVCVRCRVRRSKVSHNPVFDDYIEMSCTMRNWKPTRGRSSDAIFMGNNGPELLLQPVADDTLLRLSSNSSSHARSVSAGRARSGSLGGSVNNRRQIWADLQQQHEKRQEQNPENQPTAPEPFSILIKDVIVVDTEHHEAPLYITHESLGYFEMSFLSCPAHDVVMAFLCNSLPPERMSVSIHTPRTVDSGELDVETLTARRMQQRVEDESFTEKFRRKVLLFSNRIEEFSASIADCACYGSGDDAYRQSPPSNVLPTCTFELLEDLEVEQAPSQSPTVCSGASSCAV